MASPFANLADLRKHWPALPSEDETEAEQKLIEAALMIRQQFKDIDSRIARGDIDEDEYLRRMTLLREHQEPR